MPSFDKSVDQKAADRSKSHHQRKRGSKSRRRIKRSLPEVMWVEKPQMDQKATDGSKRQWIRKRWNKMPSNGSKSGKLRKNKVEQNAIE